MRSTLASLPKTDKVQAYSERLDLARAWCISSDNFPILRMHGASGLRTFGTCTCTILSGGKPEYFSFASYPPFKPLYKVRATLASFRQTPCKVGSAPPLPRSGIKFNLLTFRITHRYRFERKTSDFDREVVILKTWNDKQVSAINVKHASTKENLYKLITEFVTNKRGEGGNMETLLWYSSNRTIENIIVAFDLSGNH